MKVWQAASVVTEEAPPSGIYQTRSPVPKNSEYCCQGEQQRTSRDEKGSNDMSSLASSLFVFVLCCVVLCCVVLYTEEVKRTGVLTGSLIGSVAMSNSSPIEDVHSK